MDSKKLKTIVLLIIGFIIYPLIMPSHSIFECNNSKCEVLLKTLAGRILQKEDVKISEIENFYTLNGYAFWKKKNKRNNYYIFVKTKTGETKLFFKNSEKSRTIAESKVRELNNALKQQPVNIKVRY